MMFDNFLGPYLLGPNDENQGIYTGDARKLIKGIPWESIDLLYADPPWNDRHLIMATLDFAASSLKPGSHLLLQPGLANLPYCFEGDSLGKLRYRSVLCIHHQGDIHADWTSHIFEWWSPLVWFSNGAPRWANGNLIASLKKNTKSKQVHKWQQGMEAPLYYIRELTAPGWIILDPFTGGGTIPAVCKMLGRRWLAFEIDPATAERARERVRQIQLPFEELREEQQKMEISP